MAKKLSLPYELYLPLGDAFAATLMDAARYTRPSSTVGRYVLVETMMVQESSPIVTNRKPVGERRLRITACGFPDMSKSWGKVKSKRIK